MYKYTDGPEVAQQQHYSTRVVWLSLIWPEGKWRRVRMIFKRFHRISSNKTQIKYGWVKIAGQRSSGYKIIQLQTYRQISHISRTLVSN